LLRLKDADGQRRLVFRLLLANGGCNYHELAVQRTTDGSVRVVDIYVYLAGTWISQQIRHTFLNVAVHDNRSLLQKLTGYESDFIKHATEIAQLVTHVKTQEWQEAMNVYRRLPPSVQHDKTMLILRLQASQQIGDDEYLAAIGAIQRKFPNDPAFELLGIDGYVMRQQHAKALECVDRLDKSIGGDPYLEVLRANILTLRDRRADAILCCRRAVANDATLWDAHVTLVELLIAERDHKELAAALDTVETNFDADALATFEDLDLSEFLASAEGKAWSQARQ
jgi:predicted Zn-dependent protease